jgi:V8-like Glu-specific endopeptidase
MLRVCALELASLGSQHSQARSVFLLGAVLSSAVAVVSLLVNRIGRNREVKAEVFAGTDAPFAPPQRPKIDTSRLAIAALLSAAASVAAFCLPPKSVVPMQESAPSPDLSPIALPAAGAIGPGVGIYVRYADGSGGMGCTAGFLVRTRTGQNGVLTAGQCNRPGEASKVTVNLAGILPYATMGTFSQTVSEGVRTEQHDIGLILLDGDNVPTTPAIAGSIPVSGVTTKLRTGEELCKFGMSSGAATCGQIVKITKSKVTFLAPGECGDSGGPVYLIKSDGTASAVGIHIGGGNPDNPDAGCSAPAVFSVAELVQPWLNKWNLTVVTAQSARPH